MASASASSDLTLGMGAPGQAGDLVNGGGVSGGRRSGLELFGEHSFSVRDQVPPKGAHDFRQSSAAAKNGSCNGFRFSGSIGTATSLDIPRLCRDTGPPSLAGFVFLGFRSPNRREFAPTGKVSACSRFASTRRWRCLGRPHCPARDESRTNRTVHAALRLKLNDGSTRWTGRGSGASRTAFDSDHGRSEQFMGRGRFPKSAASFCFFSETSKFDRTPMRRRDALALLAGAALPWPLARARGPGGARRGGRLHGPGPVPRTQAPCPRHRRRPQRPDVDPGLRPPRTTVPTPPPDGGTLFRIGSITKAFTGQVLASLAADGVVSLADPLTKYVPDFIAPLSEGGRPIRLIDLATHSAGLPREVPHEPGPPDNPFITITPEAFAAGSRPIRCCIRRARRSSIPTSASTCSPPPSRPRRKSPIRTSSPSAC